jgi:hypothetical protein
MKRIPGSTQMEITYPWWRRVVPLIIVEDTNLVWVLWSTVHSNVPSWWKYITAPVTLAMAGGELDLIEGDTQR